MADPLLKVVDLLVGGQVRGQVQRGQGLADAGDVVLLAFDRHDGAAADGHQVDRLVPVHHLALGQPMLDEDRVDGLEVELRGQVHDGEIFVVELPVLLGRIAVALDEMLEHVVMRRQVTVDVHGHEARRAAGSPDRHRARIPDGPVAP